MSVFLNVRATGSVRSSLRNSVKMIATLMRYIKARKSAETENANVTVVMCEAKNMRIAGMITATVRERVSVNKINTS